MYIEAGGRIASQRGKANREIGPEKLSEAVHCTMMDAACMRRGNFPTFINLCVGSSSIHALVHPDHHSRARPHTLAPNPPARRHYPRSWTPRQLADTNPTCCSVARSLHGRQASSTTHSRTLVYYATPMTDDCCRWLPMMPGERLTLRWCSRSESYR